MRSKLLISSFIVLTIILMAGCSIGSVKGVDSIATNNYANHNLEYYYYIPSAIVKNKPEAYPLLVMIPGLSGRGDKFVSSEFKQFAEAENFIIVAPSFVWDEKNWDSKKSYQYPAAWSGNALLKIIDQLEEKNGLTVSKLYLFGFSAGAQFALRFCVWKPELCAASAAHGSGGSVIPNRKIDTRFFVTAGTQDATRINKAKTFYEHARYHGIPVIYKEYNTGHALTSAQIKDSLDFFRSSKDMKVD